MIFSKHRRKIESARRFGSKEFRNRIKLAGSHKRIFLGKSFLVSLRNGSIKSKFLVRLIILLFIVSAYYLFLSPKFRIENVKATGNLQVTSEQITSAIIKAGKERTFLIPKNHYILMSQGRLNSMLKSDIPSIKEVVKINRHLPNFIEIEVVERNKAFLFKTNNQAYVVDEEGFVIKQTEERSDLLLVENQVQENVAIGEALNPKLVAFIVSMDRQWSGKINTQIAVVKIPGRASFEVQFVSGEGWSVLFDAQRPVLAQLSNLALLLSQEIPSKDRPRLAYIDLRLAKWAYYCYKASPCEAKPQEELTSEPK